MEKNNNNKIMRARIETSEAGIERIYFRVVSRCLLNQKN